MKRIFELALVTAVVCFALAACNDEVEFSGQVVNPVVEEPATPKLPEQPQTESTISIEPVVPARPPLLLQETFPSSTEKWVETSYDFEKQTARHTLRLDEVKNLSAGFDQINREQNSQTWVQGHEGTQIEESFTLQSGVLDLAIVVDDSSSMSREHEDLKDKLVDLLSELQGVDWQMGIGTTTSSCLRPDGTTIFSNDADYVSRFGSAVTPGTDGSGDERGLERGAELLAGQCDEVTRPWLRDDSLVAVLFVSDEDSYCGFSCRGNERSNKFVADMKKIRPGRKELLRAYALTWNSTDCVKDSTESEGKLYREVVEKIGGLTLPICQDFSDLLRRISVDVASVLDRKVVLTHPPISGSLQVVVGGQPHSDYSLDGLEVSLSSLPPGEHPVLVRYLHSPVAKRDAFVIDTPVDPSTLSVQMNNQQVDPADYDFDERTGSLVFHGMPPDNAIISAEYRVPSLLPKTFDLSSVVGLKRIVDVTVDGAAVAASEYSFDANLMQIEFQIAPPDGKRIALIYASEHIRTSYPLSLVRSDAVDYIVAHDPDSGAHFDITFTGDGIVIPEEQVRGGRDLELIVTYVVDPSLEDFEWPPYAVASSLTILSEEQSCEYSFSVQTGLVVSCPGETESITIGYEQSVPTSEIKLANNYDVDASIEVSIGDIAIPFRRTGDTLHLQGEIPNGKELLVKAYVPGN